jgi:methionyl-tRNA formyltransferase
MKIVFAGTPEIAQIVLDKLLTSGFNIDLVLTQPDRPSGRGQKLQASLVKELALQYNIPVFQPEKLRNNSEALAILQQLKPDIMIVVAYGLIIPEEILLLPKLGCINIHVSLLPKHRGAAPIQRAILEGDTVTGITIMQMDKGLDTGPILLQQQVEIVKDETSQTLHDKLAILGGQMIVEYLNNYRHIEAKAQGSNNVSYASKIEKHEAQINWNEPAEVIERKIRGFNPYPGAFSYLDTQLIKLWGAKVGPNLPKDTVPGTIISLGNSEITVSCGNGTTLIITSLQSAGKKRQSSREYINGHPQLIGTSLKFS